MTFTLVFFTFRKKIRNTFNKLSGHNNTRLKKKVFHVKEKNLFATIMSSYQNVMVVFKCDMLFVQVWA